MLATVRSDRRGRHDAPIDARLSLRPFGIGAIDQLRARGPSAACRRAASASSFAQQARDRMRAGAGASSPIVGKPGASQCQARLVRARSIAHGSGIDAGSHHDPRRAVGPAEQHRLRQQQGQRSEQQQPQQQQQAVRRNGACGAGCGFAASQRSAAKSVVRCSMRRTRWISSGSSQRRQRREPERAAAGRSSCGPASPRPWRGANRRAAARRAAGRASIRRGGCRWRRSACASAARAAANRSRKSSRTAAPSTRAVPRRFRDRRKRWPPRNGKSRSSAVSICTSSTSRRAAAKRSASDRPRASSKKSLSSSTSDAGADALPQRTQASLRPAMRRARDSCASSSRQRSRWRGPAAGGDQRAVRRRRARSGRSDRPGAARARSRRRRSSSRRPARDHPGRAASACAIDALASITSHTVSGLSRSDFAHEEAVGARIEFPVDLAQLVAGFVGAVLGELEAGAAAAARCRPKPCAPAGCRVASRSVPAARARRRDQVGGGSDIGRWIQWTASRESIASQLAAEPLTVRRERHVAQQHGDDVVGAALLGFGGERQQQAMAQHRRGECDDVLARRGAAAVQQRARLRGQHQRLAGARTGAPAHPFATSAGAPSCGRDWRAPGA